jgi:hypothetical protein
MNAPRATTATAAAMTTMAGTKIHQSRRTVKRG